MFLAWLKPRKTVLDKIEQKYRALPFPIDCEWNRLNANKYTAFMDHSRMAFSVRVGVSILTLAKKRWIFTIAEQHINYISSVKSLVPFVVTTQMVYWNEKYCFAIQEFYQNDKIRARGFVKFVVRKPSGVVPMPEVIAATGYHGQSPQVPKILLDIFPSLNSG
jgi:acyl-CoA thioesterase FadM